MRAVYLRRNKHHRTPKTHKLSFASHAKAAEWVTLKNRGMRPRDFTKSSTHKAWFRCADCNHDRQQSINNIQKGFGCGYCAKRRCDPCGCNWCNANSFHKHPMASQWHRTKNEGKQPGDFWPSSHTTAWFKCPECNHDRQQTIGNVQKGKGCTYCARQCDPCGCKWCNDNSLDKHPMTRQWHTVKNDGKTPADFWPSSHKKAWFKCSDCNEDRQQRINDVQNGQGCGSCRNKTERLIYEHIRLQAGVRQCMHNYRVDWCCSEKAKRHLPFDIFSWTTRPALPIIDECDGPQHFVQVSSWNAPDLTQTTDAYKIIRAIQNGHHVRRHVQEDVWQSRVDWKAWIDATNGLLAGMTSPVVCLPEPQTQWSDLADSLVAEADRLDVDVPEMLYVPCITLG